MTFRAPVAVFAAALAAAALTAGGAQAFAPAATAPVHPGVQTRTDGGQCTANFVFTGADGSVYIGQAAHCSGTGGQTETDGCTSRSLPIGTPVTVDGATRPGTLAYNSWIRMQELGEQDPDTCAYNDFALVKLDPEDAAARTNPSVPFWGGPTALNTTGSKAVDTVLSYGNSSLRAGITLLSPKQGLSLGADGSGWNHPVYTVTPGIPGDSGSAFLDRSGRALGVLSTLALAPLPASNGVGDLSRELAYLNRTTTLGVSLALGTVPFRGPLL
jgi:hypothetical protein